MLAGEGEAAAAEFQSVRKTRSMSREAMFPNRLDPFKLVAEGLAILLSILLALGADAWWDRRGDLEREQSLLDDLEAEFIATQEEIGRSIEWHEQNERDSRRLYLIAVGEEAAPGTPQLDTLVRAAMVDARSFNAADGVYRAVVSAGDFRFVQDDSLRYALAGWESVLADALEDEAWVFRDVQQEFVPYLIRRLHLSGVYAPPLEGGALQRSSTEAYEALLTDLRFQNYLLTKANGEAVIGRELEDLRVAADQIIRLIREYRAVGSS